ncbi:MAG: hypothetical protein EA424_02025 [Planctomycetaceae bacterium]|nr:MAG: hypothetical protein EA424_02025 [Planctomycetaceae bacterium]
MKIDFCRTLVPHWLTAVLSIALICQSAQAQRPTAPRLLPKDTLLYLRIADMPDLIERFQETSAGRISQDEQVRPLLDHLWGSLVEVAEPLEDLLGVPLQDLLSIPQGETCLALVAPETGFPAVVLLIDAGDRMPALDKVLEQAEFGLFQQGAVRTVQDLDGTEMVVNALPGGQRREMAFVQRDGTLILGSNSQVIQSMIDAWDGRPTSRLSENTNFTAIMKRCAGDEKEPPQITFFIDPLELTKRIARGSLAGQAVIALLPALGLDGVRGLGGSVALATEQYDNVTHVHLMLDSPRKGVVEILALRGGDLTPEPWVPADAVSYTSLNWDFETSYNALRTLFDAIRGEGALDREVNRRVSDPLGIPFEQDLLAALDGRVTIVSWMVRPARLNSRANLLGLKLKDPKAFRQTLQKLIDQFPGQLERQALGGNEYWSIRVPRPTNDGPDRPLLREPDPAIAILDDYLLLSDSSELLKHAMVTRGRVSGSLANELDYKLIASRIRRQAGGDTPGMLAFDRPEESLRLLYELATGDTTQQQLRSQADNNPFFGALDGALRENPLPPFAVIARYLAPGGSLITNDATGFHYTSFTLRRQ